MHLFREKRASLLGTGVVYAARKEMNMSWTSELETMTRYSESDLTSIHEELNECIKPVEEANTCAVIAAEGKENSP